MLNKERKEQIKKYAPPIIVAIIALIIGGIVFNEVDTAIRTENIDNIYDPTPEPSKLFIHTIIIVIIIGLLSILIMYFGFHKQRKEEDYE